MTIILIQAPCWGPQIPPLQLATLSSYLRNKQHKVFVLDLNIDFYHKVKRKWKKYWQLAEYEFWQNNSLVKKFVQENDKLIQLYLKRILVYDVQIVGFSVYNTSLAMSLILAKKIKERNKSIFIVFGGPECSRYLSGKYIIEQDFVDIVVCGEGEETLAEIVRQVEKNGKVSLVPGTLLKKDGQIIECGERPLIEDLNLLPFPDFSDFQLDKYSALFTLPISSSRGCIRRCVFCNEWPFWKRYRYRKGEVIFEEIKYQLRKYPRVLVFEFAESLVNGNLKEMSKLCDLIIKNKLKIFWCGQAIIRPEMTPELLNKFRKAGCDCLDYGVESGSDEVLSKMRKGFTVEIAEQVIRDTYRAGINVGVNFIFGFPGETEEDFQQTLDFVRRNKNYIRIVAPDFWLCGIYPGSYLYTHSDEYGITPYPNGPFWQTKDGKNTYPIRLKRFERFCKFIHCLGIDSVYPYTRLVRRYKLLGDHHFDRKEYEKAIKYYKLSIRLEQPYNETLLRRMKFCHKRIKDA